MPPVGVCGGRSVVEHQLWTRGGRPNRQVMHYYSDLCHITASLFICVCLQPMSERKTECETRSEFFLFLLTFENALKSTV